MRSYDVCVIGSGAAGGVMAKELCEGGAQVMMLEAGEELPLLAFSRTAGPTSCLIAVSEEKSRRPSIPTTSRRWFTRTATTLLWTAFGFSAGALCIGTP